MDTLDAYRAAQDAKWQAVLDADKAARAAGVLLGRYFMTPVADGHATYVVTTETAKTITITAQQIYDGYTSPLLGKVKVMARGEAQRLLDQQAHQDDFWNSVQNGNADFWASRKPGEIVHYHNGFGSFVRGEIVRDEDGQNKMRPIALVGKWRDYDARSKFTAWGEVNHPYHVESLRSGKLMQPGESNMYESPSFSRSVGDPRPLAALDTSPEPMTPEQAAAAPLYALRNAISAELQKIPYGNDPTAAAAAYFREQFARIKAMIDDAGL